MVLISLQQATREVLPLLCLGEGEDTNIYLGKSLLDMIREFADPIISTTSDVTTRINNYNDDVAEYQIDLEELNERIENSRERYTKQFSDMNSAVTGFKKTEELLTNFQEAWKASIKKIKVSRSSLQRKSRGLVLWLAIFANCQFCLCA